MLIWTVCGEEIFGVTNRIPAVSQNENAAAENCVITVCGAKTALRKAASDARLFTKCRTAGMSELPMKKNDTSSKKNVLSSLDILRMM